MLQAVTSSLSRPSFEITKVYYRYCLDMIRCYSKTFSSGEVHKLEEKVEESKFTRQISRKTFPEPCKECCIVEFNLSESFPRKGILHFSPICNCFPIHGAWTPASHINMIFFRKYGNIFKPTPAGGCLCPPLVPLGAEMPISLFYFYWYRPITTINGCFIMPDQII